MPLRWLLAVALLAAVHLRAEDQKPDSPRITAIAPLDLIPGQETTLRIRGLKLSNATEVRFPGVIKAEIKEKKAAEIPNGLDAKDVGDTQLEVKLIVPGDLPAGPLALSIVTPDGTTAPRELRVLDVANCVDEKEPNGSFREAQSIELGKTLRGTIKEDKDVDVFQFDGKTGQRIAAEVFAARGASLLDSALTLLDARGHQLACADDSLTRDSQLTLTLPADGRYFLTVQDAHDRGSAWHGYELSVKETP
jgi:Bacterial pre-peptidase C-terminal domain